MYKILTFASVAALSPALCVADWFSGSPYPAAPTWPQYTDNLSDANQARAMAFDNFTWVPGAGGGIVDFVGGQYFRYGAPYGAISTIDTAYWEIRSGMSAGNGGTLVASGSGAVFPYSTGVTQGGEFVGGVTVDVPNFLLPAGNYWFGLAIGTTTGPTGWFSASTDGTSGIGGPLGDDVHLYYQEVASTVTWNYVDGTTLFPPGTTGFDPSYWIGEVPSPGGASLMLLAVAGAVRRRR
jgi:hypothetical protein